MVVIAPPDTPLAWDMARALVLEYATSRQFDGAMCNINEEIEQLHLRYQAPQGLFLLAQKNNQGAGCVAFRPFAEGVCEMKRLYVSPNFRVESLGKTLIETIIENSRKAGYSRLLLDSLPDMIAAKHLYQQLGFVRIAPYNNNPAPGVQHFELKL